VIKAIIFDCFGVIIADAMQVVISELAERDPAAAKQAVEIIHANNRGLLHPDESRVQIAALIGITPQALWERIQKGETKDHELLEYIRELRTRYKTALLSNVGVESLHRRFDEGELPQHFDAVIVSGELGVMKPDPEIYLHTAEKLGIEPKEGIFIDDREVHCQGARAIGMQAILYQDLLQLKRELKQILEIN
jgi:epoxide hydrolase-like predicted phosphatase